MTRILLALVAAFLAAGGTQDIRVLFIGNSLTAANDLPAMVRELAQQNGLRERVAVGLIAKPNFSLEDHWNDGEALRAVRSGRWTHVVLQQGPSSLMESRGPLREWSKRFATEARATGAKILLCGVWPPRERLQFQPDVTESYRLAATDAGGELVAVGEGWRLAWEKDRQLPLYGPDGFHPSPLGTYLGALMFFERVTGRSSSGLQPPRSVRADAKTLKLLEDSAHRALAPQHLAPSRRPPTTRGQSSIF